VEISIKIDGVDARPSGAQAGAEPSAQEPSHVAPAAELAARAAAAGAINAGPAHIPVGALAEPLVNIAAASGEQGLAGAPGDAAAAGPAPGYAQDPEPVVVEEGDAER
jgi:hypothetical protein